jgi:hypothetical protein
MKFFLSVAGRADDSEYARNSKASLSELGTEPSCRISWETVVLSLARRASTSFWIAAASSAGTVASAAAASSGIPWSPRSDAASSPGSAPRSPQFLRRELVCLDNFVDRDVPLLGNLLEVLPRLVVLLLGDAQAPDLGAIGLRVMADVIQVA